MKARHISQITTLAVDDFLIAYADDPSWLNDPYFRDAAEPGVYDLVTSEKYKQSIKADPWDGCRTRLCLTRCRTL